jgi:hypothetical protein
VNVRVCGTHIYHWDLTGLINVTTVWLGRKYPINISKPAVRNAGKFLFIHWYCENTEVSADVYDVVITRRIVLEDCLHTRRREDLKSHLISKVFNDAVLTFLYSTEGITFRTAGVVKRTTETEPRRKDGADKYSDRVTEILECHGDGGCPRRRRRRRELTAEDKAQLRGKGQAHFLEGALGTETVCVRAPAFPNLFLSFCCVCPSPPCLCLSSSFLSSLTSEI